MATELEMLYKLPKYLFLCDFYLARFTYLTIWKMLY